MSKSKMKRGPAGATAGTSLSAVEATVQSAYFSNGPEGKGIDLVTVPRVWIENAVQLLIDALDYSDCRKTRENSL